MNFHIDRFPLRLVALLVSRIWPDAGDLPPPAQDRRVPGVANPTAFKVGPAGLVVVLSSHASSERENC